MKVREAGEESQRRTYMGSFNLFTKEKIAGT